MNAMCMNSYGEGPSRDLGIFMGMLSLDQQTLSKSRGRLANAIWGIFDVPNLQTDEALEAQSADPSFWDDPAAQTRLIESSQG